MIERLGRGDPFKVIAADARVSINTAKTWAQRAYAKLAVHNAAAAVAKHRRIHSHCSRVTRLSPNE